MDAATETVATLRRRTRAAEQRRSRLSGRVPPDPGERLIPYDERRADTVHLLGLGRLIECFGGEPQGAALVPSGVLRAAALEGGVMR